MIQRKRYIDKIKPFIGKDIIKVLTGIRRSGKSVMLRLIQDEIRSQGIADKQFISFNFESLENAEFFTAESLYQELKKRISSVQGKVYLFFDEIQEVEQWEKCINSVRVDFDCDIYITGSNAKLLSGELATYLGGRYVEFVIFLRRISGIYKTGKGRGFRYRRIQELSGNGRDAFPSESSL